MGEGNERGTRCGATRKKQVRRIGRSEVVKAYEAAQTNGAYVDEGGRPSNGSVSSKGGLSVL